ncbi:Uncharacterized conserved protein, LabA/DUF88 family [Monaibacterium marinum]|uniref:Uncharacterized conserved protein, LabA/DUF88 family n=1 Tax=Pontivivens marinum TaxID=1690039 RepID=A0A2C9CTW4_9RHOB|nr:NYN domain-containing protein [Monaibacterium marinum]SOH94575.1 Uncharacterized conserved protein, LabA/DUF88 family [Monaibacterium marinum]
MTRQRVAVLIDGDNVSPKHSAQILTHAATLGQVDIARVYTCGQQNSDWLSMPGYRYMHAGAGKNAADILLCIDAMEVSARDDITTFMIATSDGDFSHLALRLREYGRAVYGMGESKSPTCFRHACTSFRALPALNTAPAKPVRDNPQYTDLDAKIRTVIAQGSQDGIKMAILGVQMHKQHGIRIATYPDKNWRTYLTQRPTLFEVGPKGPDAMVKFCPAGFVS